MTGFKKSIQKFLKLVKRSDDKKKQGESSKKEIKKFRELSFHAQSSEEDGGVEAVEPAPRPSTVAGGSVAPSLGSLQDRDHSPHLRRLISVNRADNADTHRHTGFMAGRVRSSPPRQSQDQEEGELTPSKGELTPSKPTAIVKPSHKQVDTDTELHQDQELKPDTGEDTATSVITAAASTRDEEELSTEAEVEKQEGVINHSDAEADTEEVGELPGADETVIEEAEKVVEISQQSLDALSGKIVECDGEIRRHKADIQRVNTSNEQMLIVVEEFERTIQQIVKDKEKENVYLLIQKETAQRARDEVVADLDNVERAFTDLSSKFERTRDVVASFATTEDSLKQEAEVLAGRLKAEEEKYLNKKSEAEAQLAEANERLATKQSSGGREIARLTALLRKAEMNVSSMEEKISQKTSENRDLTAMCDDLLLKLDGVAAAAAAGNS